MHFTSSSRTGSGVNNPATIRLMAIRWSLCERTSPPCNGPPVTNISSPWMSIRAPASGTRHRSFRPVALLLRQTSDTRDTARTVAMGSQHRKDREQIGAMRGIDLESLQPPAGRSNGDVLQISRHIAPYGYVRRRDAHIGTARTQDVEYLFIGLQRIEPHIAQRNPLDPPQRRSDGSGHREIGGRTPISIQEEVRRTVLLPARYRKDDFRRRPRASVRRTPRRKTPPCRVGYRTESASAK